MTGIPVYEPTGLEKIADIPYYTEGPAMDDYGNYFFTTLTGGIIFKIDSNGFQSVWAKAGCPNGQVILSDGDHLICDSGKRSIIRYSKDGKFIKNEMDRFCAGLEINTPNDVIVDSSGNIFFTDSIRNKGKVCLLSRDGKEHIIANDLDYPNGLILSQNQKWLFIAESYKNRILKMEVGNTEELLPEIEVFVTLPFNVSGKIEDNLPDGLTLDNKGNIWVAHYGMGAIHKVSIKGEILFSIKLPMPLVSNLIFIDGKTLLVTGGYGEPGPGAVFKIHL